MEFWNLPDFSWFPKISIDRQFVRQQLYTTFISKNHTSFHLRWKENLLKHLNVSKYYDNDCSLISNSNLEFTGLRNLFNNFNWSISDTRCAKGFRVSQESSVDKAYFDNNNQEEVGNTVQEMCNFKKISLRW